ncbi:phospholipase D-like domain-containing protein [Dechloromonas denitrificans]|uniref:phospholipase D-like domain-containing protein n=1 Tax=Dechloromonas denitrificans TaxID=281362 RepID=UPI001CF8ECBC|nr:phospholipase D-like domain-containing protein [Dechloromonas denitrificans]UCV05677.1 hypothetical protein KI611_10670 [Dechloromonas denitrificans]
MANEWHVEGNNPRAKFTLRIHRGESMVLLAMDWKEPQPPNDFVGFAIEYKEPQGDRYFALNNRLGFRTAQGAVDGRTLSTKESPLQKFRWVHFPRNAELGGAFTYRVSPVFMADDDRLSYGDYQEASLELGRVTIEGELNVAFTRGFVSSQAFVERYAKTAAEMATLLPRKADEGLHFQPQHANAQKALEWMGFEAREALLSLLDEALHDASATVRVVAYDLNEPEVVNRLVALGPRLRIIIDNSPDHSKAGSAENESELRLVASAGRDQVQRQHMQGLQHNKTIVVDGSKSQSVACGSTNFSWRAFYVQANNAVVLRGKKAVAVFGAAFEEYWKNSVSGFEQSVSASQWHDLGLPSVDAQVTFSPHNSGHGFLNEIANDIRDHTTSNLFFSLAFLYQTKGAMKNAILKLTADNDIFMYGMSDQEVGGLDVLEPSGNVIVVRPEELGKGVPEPFKSEPTGGKGIRMHHKFIVMDFGTPNARVYTGSYNFSIPADGANGENLLVFRHPRVVTAYVVEALRLFDHYQFRISSARAKGAGKDLALRRPPRKEGEEPWWADYYNDPRKIKDRKLFA